MEIREHSGVQAAQLSGLGKQPVLLEPDIYVSGQIGLDDIETIHSLGIRTIVDNRPDEELDGQATSRMIEESAARYGISFLYRPVWGFELGDSDLQREIWQSVDENPGPVLLYCRSGRRSSLLWAQRALDYLDRETVQARTGRAGIDPEELQMFLSEHTDRIAA